jgi:AcrR family transcriptional regulator
MATRGRPPIITDGELLDAARAVFLEHGTGATTARIAKRARVSESVIFHRHKTKEALFLAVLEREAQVPPIIEALGARVGKGSVIHLLEDVGLAVIEQGRAMAPFFMIASMMARAGDGLAGMRERMRKPSPAHLRAIRLLAGYFEGEAALGRLRAVDFDSLSRVYLGALMQHVMQQYWWKAPESSALAGREFVSSLVDVFVHGLAPARTARRRRKR